MKYEEFSKDEQVETLKRRLKQLEGELFLQDLELKEYQEIGRMKNYMPADAVTELNMLIAAQEVKIRAVNARIRAVNMQLKAYRQEDEAVDAKAG